MNELPQSVLLWLAAINVVGFLLMGLDKWKAKRSAWRIPEKTLFTAALLGGTVGVIAGMETFRHKTKHGRFKYGLPALLVVQAVAAAWLLKRM